MKDSKESCESNTDLRTMDPNKKVKPSAPENKVAKHHAHVHV
jgi:hypothetical protein